MDHTKESVAEKKNVKFAVSMKIDTLIQLVPSIVKDKTSKRDPLNAV
jgi:hypothetical protein